MKVNTHIDKTLSQEHIDIYARTHTKQIDQIIQIAQEETTIQTLCGKHYDKTIRIPIEEVLYIRSEQRQLMAYTKTQQLRIQARLYQLEAQLPNNFIRISKSEIINILNIKQLSLNPNGMIHIEMKHGEDTYSSRRYLKQLKGRLFQ